MRERRWLVIGNIGLTACLLAGCLRSALPPDAPQVRSDIPPRGAEEAQDTAGRTEQTMTDYLPSQVPRVKPDVPAATLPVKAVEIRIQEDAPPAQPADPPAPRRAIQPAPPDRPDAPSVKALRALLEHHSEEEVREQLKQCDAATRETLLRLLGSVAHLEQSGGIPRISPQQLAAWIDPLNALVISLRPRAQLTLDQMCFCKSIESFGKYRTCDLNPPVFQPGEEVRVYLQVRNFASRQVGDIYKTVLKGRLEIYDETNRNSPGFIKDIAPQEDPSRTPRQDFFVHVRFHVPLSCPPGSYTLWIKVEDWTGAPPGTKEVAPSRIDRRSLDFRVGGPASRPPKASIADVTPAR
ncbi:MAG TPA: hypothetical protein VH682_00275 [Gemmataceae bacterium]|jgi:hypothetical protein